MKLLKVNPKVWCLAILHIPPVTRVNGFWIHQGYIKLFLQHHALKLLQPLRRHSWPPVLNTSCRESHQLGISHSFLLCCFPVQLAKLLLGWINTGFWSQCCQRPYSSDVLVWFTVLFEQIPLESLLKMLKIVTDCLRAWTWLGLFATICDQLNNIKYYI